MSRAYDRGGLFKTGKSKSKSGKPTKREREAAFRAKLGEYGERFIKGLGRVAENPETMKIIAGTGFGAISLYPQTIVREHGEQLWMVQEERIDPKAAERCEAEYRDCLAACGSGAGTRECRELCGEERNRCLNQGGNVVLVGTKERWRFRFRVKVLLQNFIPDWTVPLVGVNTRDAFSFQGWKEAEGFRKADDPDVRAAELEAQASAVKEIQRDMLILGLTMGASVTTIAEVMKGVGSILQGVGEVVPG